MARGLNFYLGSTSLSVQSSNSKFSIKASIKMLTISIAREPVSHQLSILSVKDRKKDKVLQKLARKNKHVAYC